MSVSIIVALTKQRVIGCDNQIPWHLSEDLKRFKKITMGHDIIMGRKTYESIGKPLPGRQNIVVTRNLDWKQEGVRAVHSLEEALDSAVEEQFVIGGSHIYQEALPIATKLYLTLIHQSFQGDVYFPEFDLEADYTVVEQSEVLNSHQDGLPYQFITVVRKNRDN